MKKIQAVIVGALFCSTSVFAAPVSTSQSTQVMPVVPPSAGSARATDGLIDNKTNAANLAGKTPTTKVLVKTSDLAVTEVSTGQEIVAHSFTDKSGAKMTITATLDFSNPSSISWVITNAKGVVASQAKGDSKSSPSMWVYMADSISQWLLKGAKAETGDTSKELSKLGTFLVSKTGLKTLSVTTDAAGTVRTVTQHGDNIFTVTIKDNKGKFTTETVNLASGVLQTKGIAGKIATAKITKGLLDTMIADLKAAKNASSLDDVISLLTQRNKK